MSASLATAITRFDDAVSRARRDAAIDVVEDLLGDRVDPVTVMVDVIAAVQRTIGERWLRGEWSVAQEHAATAASVAALEAVARATVPSSPERGHAVVACAEHEWHALPATMIAAGLRAFGWQVTLLGASTPTARLSRYLQDLGPELTAVSCSVAAGLPTSRAFIESSTAAGIPVLAGGAAFGPDELRARALGATAWAPDLRSAIEVATSLPVVVRAVAPLDAEVTHEQAGLERERHLLVDAVWFRWLNSHDSLSEAADPERSDLLRETVGQVFHAVVGALLTGDGRLVEETARWVRSMLVVRGLGDPAVDDLGRAVGAELEDFPLAAALWKRSWPSAAAAAY